MLRTVAIGGYSKHGLLFLTPRRAMPKEATGRGTRRRGAQERSVEQCNTGEATLVVVVVVMGGAPEQVSVPAWKGR